MSRRHVAMFLVLAQLAVAGSASGEEPPTIAIGGGATRASIEAVLPASGSFYVSYPFDAAIDNAQVHVWPAAVKQCSAIPPDDGEKQTYTLPMVLSVADGKTTGRALVPHLQLDEKFCFTVSYEAIIEPSAELVERAIGVNVDWFGANERDVLLLLESTRQRLSAGFCDPSDPQLGTCSPMDLGPLARQLLLPADFLASQSEHERAQARKQQVDETTITLKRELERLPGAKTDKLPSLTWFDSFDPKFSDAGEVFLATPQGRAAVPSADDRRAVSDWMARYKTWALELMKATAQVKATQKALDDATASLKVKHRDLAITYFKKHLRAKRAAKPVVAKGRTTDFKNFFSPEIGMAAGAPLMDGGELKLVPYAAVNLYATPVERALPLDRLVHPFWQRASLTFGLSLSNALKATDASLTGTVAGAYGIVGVGWRVFPFARASILAFFAEAKRSGVLSDETQLVTALSFAISADVDVIAYISSSLKK